MQLNRAMVALPEFSLSWSLRLLLPCSGRRRTSRENPARRQAPKTILCSCVEIFDGNACMSVDARLIKRLRAMGDSDPFELNVHLRAEAGITVLFGPSGAGKSLILNCLAGFARPDEGRILVNDRLFF